MFAALTSCLLWLRTQRWTWNGDENGYVNWESCRIISYATVSSLFSSFLFKAKMGLVSRDWACQQQCNPSDALAWSNQEFLMEYKVGNTPRRLVFRCLLSASLSCAQCHRGCSCFSLQGGVWGAFHEILRRVPVCLRCVPCAYLLIGSQTQYSKSIKRAVHILKKWNCKYECWSVSMHKLWISCI